MSRIILSLPLICLLTVNVLSFQPLQAIGPKANTPSIPPFFTLEDRTRFFAVPVPGFNMNDRFMAGMAFFNEPRDSYPLKVQLLPLWSFNKRDMMGEALLAYTFQRKGNLLHSVTPSGHIRKYSMAPIPESYQFLSLENAIHASLSHQWQVVLAHRYIKRDLMVFSMGDFVKTQRNYHLLSFAASYYDTSAPNPFAVDVALLRHSNMLRTSLTFSMLVPLFNPTEGLHMRFFGGYFLMGPGNTNPETDLRFRLQSITGPRDFGFERLYLGRSEPPGSFWGHQVYESDGAFKYPTPLGQTWHWLASVNLKMDLPRLPLRGFLDMATFHGAASDLASTQKIVWVGGIQLHLLNDLLQVNFPVFVSKDLKRIAQLNKLDTYDKTITFTLAFHRLDAVQSFLNKRLVSR